jgi:DNA-directed RNA polymerase I and III subunit RPAC1
MIVEKNWIFIKKKQPKIFLKNYYSKKKDIKSFVEIKNTFSVTDFRFGVKMEFIHLSQDELLIECKEINLCYANALRRIIMCELTTVAIEKTFFYENSTVLNDEMIAHRLGLIPIFVNPSLIDNLIILNQKNKIKIILKMNVIHPFDSLKNIAIFSNSLLWKNYSIIHSWTKNVAIYPVFKDILIAKLNPGQKINVECHCSLGNGQLHAKFSPVGTTFYKIFPQIKIISEIYDQEAETIFEKCIVRVFDLEFKKIFRKKKLIVVSPNYCTFCQECIRPSKKTISKIKVGRKNHKINFIIESTGVFSPETLFHRAIFLLVGKCNNSLLTLYRNFEKS